MRRLLVLNFFPAFYPPTSGGEQRYYYLYLNLSRYYDITLLSPTYPEHNYEVFEFNKNFREYRIPKEDIHIRLHKEMDKIKIGPECSALVCALSSSKTTKYHDAYKILINDANIIVHESPYMINFDTQFGKDKKPRIYNSYNLESKLAEQILSGPYKHKYVTYITDLEYKLVNNCDLVFATSEEEKIAFQQAYGCSPEKIALAPNGIEVSNNILNTRKNCDDLFQKLGIYKSNRTVIFFGSAHPPNIEAVQFICNSIAPYFPDVIFLIAGSVCDKINHTPSNIKLLGKVNDEHRNYLLTNCDVAINPMFSGAGTNLKMLDYMSFGLPIISTPVGARGLDIKNQVHCIISEAKAFIHELDRLLKDPNLRKEIGQAAKKLVYSKYSWRSITDNIYIEIEKMLEKIKDRIIINMVKMRKKILLINDFPVSKPASGGEVRICNLFSSLSRFFDVNLICFTNEYNINEVQITTNFKEIRIPKTEEHRSLEAKWNKLTNISVSDIISSIMCTENETLLNYYKSHSTGADIIIFQHPYLSTLLKIYQPNVPIIYEAHNFEQKIKKEILFKHPRYKDLLNIVTSIEKHLCNLSTKIICVSKEDYNNFSSITDPTKIEIIQNGVNTKLYQDHCNNDNIKKFFKGYPISLFIGSGHPPNIEAIKFIIDTLALRLPNIYFIIIGSACDFFKTKKNHSNTLLFGVVDDDIKRILISIADIAINPMYTGGGSSLKIAEYLAAGLPVVSTKVGIRGFDLIDGEHVIVASHNEFADKISYLLSNHSLMNKLRNAGRIFSHNNLDWDILANKYMNILNNVIDKSASKMICLPKKKLLVLTYRFTLPPLGGAETYLNEILKVISNLNDFDIDIATYFISTLNNRFHFSIEYNNEDIDAHIPSYINNIYRFKPDRIKTKYIFNNCKKLYSLWNKENILHARFFVGYYEKTLLLGGWYLPEKHGNQIFRWTSNKCEVYCPKYVNGIEIVGYANNNKRIKIYFNDIFCYSLNVDGSFHVKIDVPKNNSGVMTLEICHPFNSKDDPRTLGVIVNELFEKTDNITNKISLTDDYENYLRLRYPEKWVSSLIEITSKRNNVDDRLIYFTRGPLSRELESWLSNNISNYDVLLIQGVPFSTSVLGVYYARKHGIRCAILPHYHMDDKYYHWKIFYNAFRNADIVFSAPNSSKKMFFDKIGANAICIPGGGINPAEYENLDSCITDFKRLHPYGRPFVLILGRKSGAKKYNDVIKAIDIINNQKGHVLDAVIIGIDEDKEPILSQYAYYYGHQSRRITLGALASCSCLISMSESESFGIVIIEAWMCKKPVIANKNCIAFNDLIENGIDGFLVANMEELIDSIIYLHNNSVIANDMGQRGYEKASNKYSWEYIGRIINSYLFDLASSKSQ
ncbi:glycosyltransferase [Desulfofundulus thermobenzoicus]|uniref:Glycosyltransferase n=1 Tax=Desulfofundulus thermobenzoicus TaxID=29376 RepID=A0A6N7IN35_9FIRM|nr:glycosyltransferase [Desulfofundulus thermobenzoicus]MQL51392.1 glycosyltransferase [Desulfofundulus thermobenzoicus]